MAEQEYTVLSPIKVVGDEIPKDERPVALKGQRQRTHDSKVVSDGTVTLSDEDAAPLLEAGAIRLAGVDPEQTHDPDLVGYEGASREATADPVAPPEGGTTPSGGGSGEQTLEGVFGEDLASTLEAGGYTSVDQVQSASDEDLRQVEGLGPKSLEKIRAAENSA